jgi:transcriptional regulator with XRE-family HTH domain
VRDGLEERWAELGEFIRAQRRLAQMSVRRLAELAEVSNPYLSQIERGLRRPSADILQQIARALRISAETLYVRAGILDQDETRPAQGVAEAIREDAELNEEQKQTLLTVYETFRLQQQLRSTNPGAREGTTDPKGGDGEESSRGKGR